MTSIESSSAVDVWQQSHLARTLDGHGDLDLVAPAGAGDAARADLAFIGHHAAKSRDVLEVDLFDLLFAEVAVAAARLADPTGLRRLLAPRLWFGARHACSLLVAPDGAVTYSLERYVIVRLAEVALGRLRAGAGEPGAGTLAALRGARAVPAATLAAAVAGADELDVVGHDRDGLTLLAVLRLPLAPAQPAFDGDLAALGEILRAALALCAEDVDVEVVGLVAPLSGGRVLDAIVDRNSETAHAGPAAGGAELAIAREMADGHDDVH